MKAVRLLRPAGGRGIVVLILLASLPFWFIQTKFELSVATLALVFMTASLGWNIISGFGGQTSFGHSIFFGIGAYTTAILEVNYKINAYLCLLLGIAGALVAAVLLGWVTLRLRGIYFSLATYALTLVFAILAGHYKFTGGQVGITMRLLGNSPGSFSFTNPLAYYYIGMLLAAVAFVAEWLVSRSRLGLQLRAINADQDAAAACGVMTFRTKQAALAISAVPAALAGTVYMQYVGFIDPASAFGTTVATQIAVIAFVGGAGRLWGPVLGAVLLVPLQQVLRSQLSNFPSGFDMVVYALVVLAVLWIEPRGLMSLRWWRHGRRSPEPASPGTLDEQAGGTMDSAVATVGKAEK